MFFFLDKVFSSLVKQFFTAVKKTTHIQGKHMWSGFSHKNCDADAYLVFMQGVSVSSNPLIRQS